MREVMRLFRGEDVKSRASGNSSFRTYQVKEKSRKYGFLSLTYVVSLFTSTMIM